MKVYELIIVGTGPAGLTAAIYAARYKLDFLCLGREHGGVANEAFRIENFPGNPDISGVELMNIIRKQAEKLGATIINTEVRAIRKEKENFLIVTSQNPGEKMYARNVLLALGTERRKLKIPGEEEFHGKGVSYCATCDGFFFKNKVVGVVGGGDSALTAAILLADIAKKVYLIHRGKEFRAMPAWIEVVKTNPKINTLMERSLKEIKGSNKVESVIFNETKEELKLDGVFIEIGATPAITIINGLGVKLDKTKHVFVSKEQETNIPGIYAAGDLTTGSNKLKQIITACAEGAIAVNSIYKKIKKES